MNRFHRLFVIVLFAEALCCARGAAPAATPSPSPVSLQDVSRTLSQARSIFTHFVQERHLALFQEPLRSEGYLFFQEPGRVRWEVTQPYKSIMLSDGSGVSQFEYVDDQWKRLDIGLAGPMQRVVSQIAEVMKGQFSEDKEYSASVTNSDSGPVVLLVPRNEKMRRMMQAIEVHLEVDLKAARQVVLREKGGDFTRIRFDEQVVNPTFQEKTFDRKQPLSLEVVRPAPQARSR